MSKFKLETQVAQVTKQEVAKTPYRLLINLLQSYVQHPQLTPTEFVEEGLAANKISESIGLMFINVYRHIIFLRRICEFFRDYLVSCNTIRADQQINHNEGIITFYMVIFELTGENWNNIYINFMSNPTTLNWALKFLTLEESMLRIIEEGCKIYDKEYLLGTILQRLLQNECNLEKMVATSTNDAEKIRMASKWKPTQSRGPSMMTRVKATTIQKLSEASVPNFFESTPVPETTYKPYDAEKYLQKEWSKNRKMAYALLAEAKQLNWKCAESKPPPKPPSPVAFKQIVPRALPKFTPVVVKTTTAALLRQAALFTKEKEAEIKEIENLMSGAIGDNNNSFLEEMRRSKEEELLQDIERKHLQGLLTREEAILAKQRQQQQNQAKKQQYQEERVKLLETIDKFRREEEDKNRQVIEKVQAIESSAKDAEAKLLKERRCNAKLIDYETQVLLKRMREEREEELNKKMQLIKELKLLQQINARNNKVEFDPTETNNLGLLGEMSIAELQERLALLKVTMKEERDQRKAKIIEEKKKQQAMLEDMKHFVETAKIQKCKPIAEIKQKKVIKKPVPDDIKQLREKLKLAREQRLNGGNSFTTIL